MWINLHVACNFFRGGCCVHPTFYLRNVPPCCEMLATGLGFQSHYCKTSLTPLHLSLKIRKVVETQVCNIFKEAKWNQQKTSPGVSTLPVILIRAKNSEGNISTSTVHNHSKEKNYETQRIFRKIDPVFRVGGTQTFRTVALQRVLSSVCVWLLQSHTVT